MLNLLWFCLDIIDSFGLRKSNIQLYLTKQEINVLYEVLLGTLVSYSSQYASYGNVFDYLIERMSANMSGARLIWPPSLPKQMLSMVPFSLAHVVNALSESNEPIGAKAVSVQEKARLAQEEAELIKARKKAQEEIAQSFLPPGLQPKPKAKCPSQKPSRRLSRNPRNHNKKVRWVMQLVYRH